MTTTSTDALSPTIAAFLAAVSADENLKILFTDLFADADSDAGQAVIIARAAEVGVPISLSDLNVMRRSAADLRGEEALSDTALDAVGGGFLANHFRQSAFILNSLFQKLFHRRH